MFLSEMEKMDVEKHYDELLKDLSREELVDRIIKVNRCLQAGWPNAPAVIDSCMIELNQYVKRLSM